MALDMIDYNIKRQLPKLVDFDDDRGNQFNNFYQTSYGDVKVTNSSGIHVGTKIKKLVVGNFVVTNRPRTKRDYVIKGLCYIILIIIFLVILWFSLSYFINKVITEKETSLPAGVNNVGVFKEIVFISIYIKCHEEYSCYSLIKSSGAKEKCNFFIDSYGNRHTGTDWEKEASYLQDYCKHCLQICFIGDFNVSELKEKMLRTLKHDILFEGMNTGKLNPEYIISPFCCFKKGSNPGLNILKWLEGEKNVIRGCRSNVYNCPWNISNGTALKSFEASSTLDISKISTVRTIFTEEEYEDNDNMTVW